MAAHQDIALVIVLCFTCVLGRPYNDGLSQQYQQYLQAQYPTQYYMYPQQQNSQYNYNTATVDSTSQSIEASPVAPNIMSQMKDLTEDVAGFHDAMAGMAEAMIVNKENKDGFTVEEKLQDASSYTNNGLVSAAAAAGSKKSKLSRKQKHKVAKKLASERRRFEKEMVKFFTSFICDKDC